MSIWLYACLEFISVVNSDVYAGIRKRSKNTNTKLWLIESIRSSQMSEMKNRFQWCGFFSVGPLSLFWWIRWATQINVLFYICVPMFCSFVCLFFFVITILSLLQVFRLYCFVCFHFDKKAHTHCPLLCCTSLVSWCAWLYIKKKTISSYFSSTIFLFDEFFAWIESRQFEWISIWYCRHIVQSVPRVREK